jgi:CTP synthase
MYDEGQCEAPVGKMKYLVVTGGVLSGLGKGISASSIGRLLSCRGYKVVPIKIDPYLNCDAGTMSPYQHGEVFVLDDGTESDLDLGNYERFLDVSLRGENNITTGKVFREVITKERRGDYLGKTVQIIPHITQEIRRRIDAVGSESHADILLIEVGGTVGDIESMWFLEAIRQLRQEKGTQDVMVCHTTLVPVLNVVGEQKTKPTQHSVKELRAIGITPDVIIGRCEVPLTEDTRQKIAAFTDVPARGVISAHDAPTIYHVPRIFEEQGLTDYILQRLSLPSRENTLPEWTKFVDHLSNVEGEVEVAIVGKYTELRDSYLSHIEAIHHCEAATGRHVKIRWVESEQVEQGVVKDPFAGVDGIVIPGGFGWRGIEGKIQAARFARENKVPFLGICLGFQVSTIEFARDVLGLGGANSTEFEPKSAHPVIDLLPEQHGVGEMGATMRLGSHRVLVEPGSGAARMYGATEIHERHRHRYEVNPKYIPKFEEAGWHFTGKSEDGRRMEIYELKGHPYMVGCQFHPELKSRPTHPSPIYLGLVRAAIERRFPAAQIGEGAKALVH